MQPQQEPQRDVSHERQAAHYIGLALVAIGFLSFFSTFISAAMNFGDFNDFESRTRSMALRAVIGMALMIVGGIVAGIGNAGLAGSGVKLDPRQARRDLEPHSRAFGGMIADAVDEFRTEQKLGEPAVKVRCRACGALNDETAKFCDQCGQAL